MERELMAQAAPADKAAAMYSWPSKFFPAMATKHWPAAIERESVLTPVMCAARLPEPKTFALITSAIFVMFVGLIVTSLIHPRHLSQNGLYSKPWTFEEMRAKMMRGE